MTATRAGEREGSPGPRTAYAAAWVLLWAVYTALFAASGVPVGMAARAAAAAAIPPAILGLAALGLAKRWPWPPAGRSRLAARLVAAIVGLAASSVVLWLLLVELDLKVLHSAAAADDGALDVAVPPFALQPLVENAIVHGVAPRAGGGRIEVSARRLDGRLRLCVRDDGPGASEEQIAASPRTGLRLLRERLAALYAGRARMLFETPPGGGFGVVLDLPDDARGEETPRRSRGQAERGPGFEGRERPEQA